MMMLTRTSFVAGLSALAMTAGFTACASDRTETVVVGSKDFTEEILLGEMYAQLLEHGGIRVHRRLGLGGTQVAMAALQRGSIDLYPEYTGTALFVELHLPLIHDAASLYKKIAAEYEHKYHLTWLQPAPMNDTQALAVTQATAAAMHLSTLTDLSKRAPQLRLGAVPEFLDRADGLPGLKAAYGGFAFKETRLLDIGLKYRALLARDVDVVVAFGTDGEIAADNLVVLKDDRRVWPVYQAAPVVRDVVLQRFPQIRRILNGLAPTLTDSVMRRLNEAVSVDKREVEDVARQYLQSRGFVKAA